MRRRNTFAYRSLLYWATVSLEMWTVDKCTNRKRVCVVNSTNIAARNSLRLGANVPAIAAKRHTRKWMEHGGSQLTERRRGGRLRRFLVAMATPFSAKKNRKNLQPQTERSLAFSLSVLLEPRSTLVWLALCCFSLFCFFNSIALCLFRLLLWTLEHHFFDFGHRLFVANMNGYLNVN